MITGFNHNFTYHTFKLHIQTEDCGVKKPRIETHLFRDGVIIASNKTSYEDILKVDDLGKVVEELMKDQHRKMLRQLKNGEYDAILGVTPDLDVQAAELEPDLPGKSDIAKPAVDDSTTSSAEMHTEIRETALETQDLAAETGKVEATEEESEPEGPLPSLEELVLKYFLGDSGKGLKDRVF